MIDKILEEYNNFVKIGRFGKDKKMSSLISTILSFRYLRDFFDNDPKGVLNSLFKQEDINKLVYPCDILELRQILSQRKILAPKNVALFSNRFAKKYLNRYPIFINLKVAKTLDDIGNCLYEFGGIYLFKDNILDISDGTISDIVIKEPLEKEKKLVISNIIDDTEINFNISFENSLPGVSSYNPKLAESTKLAQDVTKNYVIKKYKGIPPNPPIGNPLDLQVGTKVRWRNRGLLLKQYYGKVINITNKWIFVEWKGREGKDVITKFPFGNPALIWQYLARAEE